MKRVVVLLAVLTVLGACKRREEPVTSSAEPRPRGSKRQAESRRGTDVGSTMPEYSAMWLDGSKFELSGHREKVVLLNLWATWCGPCRYEIPELEKIHVRFASRGFEVIGVSVDEGGVDAVRQFVSENKMTYPIVLDAEGKLADVLQTSVLPTSVLIDRKGTIVWRSTGLIEENDERLKKAIEKAL